MAVSQRGDKTIVFDKPTRQVIDLSKKLPGRRKWKDGCLLVEATGDNLQVMLTELPALSEAPLPAIAAYLAAGVAGQQTRLQKAATLPPEASSYPFKTQPFDHQRQAFGISRDKEAFAYFMEMGTGKSKLGVDVAGHLWIQGYIDLVIIAAPNGVHRQWVNEAFPNHMSDEVRWKGFAHRSGMRKKDKDDYHSTLGFTGLKVITIASESLSSASGQEFVENLVIQYGKRTLFIIDESHQFSNAKASRTKFVLKMSKSVGFRRILSGSPITDGTEKLFPQFAFLSPSILGHTSQTSFEREFCQLEQIYGAPRGAMRIVGYRNLQKLQERIDGFTFRVTKEECLDLPEKIYQTIEVEWNPEQKKAYDNLRKYMATEIEGVEVQAPLAITLMTKLQQILGGSVLSEDGVNLPVPTNKISTLMDIVEQNPNGGIVWVKYLSEVSRIREAFDKAGVPYGVYVGDTPQAERDRITKKGAVTWLIANESASTGLDLPWWNLAVYFSNTFNAAVRWQSEDRFHRIGQTQTCHYIDLVIPDSIDEVVVKALARKREVADYIWSPSDLLRDTLNLREE